MALGKEGTEYPVGAGPSSGRRLDAQPEDRWSSAGDPVRSKSRKRALHLGRVLGTFWLDIRYPPAKGLGPGGGADASKHRGGFILAGGALCLFLAGPAARWARLGSQLLACATVVLGSLTLSEYLFGDLGIDQILFQDLKPVGEAPYPGRMPPTAAFNFTALGAALLLLRGGARRLDYAAQLLTLAPLTLGLLTTFGYTYGIPELHTGASFISLALHASVTFIVLSVGVLCARPDRGLIAIVISDTTGGVVTRRLLPAALGFPLLIGWLRLEGQRAGLFSTEYGLSLVVVVIVVTLTGLIVWTARELDRGEVARRRAAAELQGLLEATPDAFVVVDEGGTMKLVNTQAELGFGYDRKELLGQAIEMLVPDGLQQAHVVQRSAYLRTPSVRPMGANLNLSARRKDGGEFPVEISLSPLETPEGMLVISVVRDVTQRRRLEEQLVAANR